MIKMNEDIRGFKLHIYKPSNVYKKETEGASWCSQDYGETWKRSVCYVLVLHLVIVFVLSHPCLLPVVSRVISYGTPSCE